MYMMERFLERLSLSKYRDNFIIKGGILVTAIVGVSYRSTMDIDTTIKNINLSATEILQIIEEISDINLNDGVSFKTKDAISIMDEMEYPGIRITLDASMDGILSPLKIDISTGDVITPHEIEFSYNLLLERRTIDLWAYNTETILAEKLQTILTRGILNTRMRDFYDIVMILNTSINSIDTTILKKAFEATCKKRKTQYQKNDIEEIVSSIEMDSQLRKYWQTYQKKFNYASDVSYNDTIDCIKKISSLIL